MTQKQTARLSYILFVFFFVAAALIILVLGHFGVDVMDPSFWTADPYLIVRGAVPFSDNWHQSAQSFLLIAPFVWLFTTATGGTEGIQLFMLYVQFFVNLATSVLIWFTLRKRMESFWTAIFCLLFFDALTNKVLNYYGMALFLQILGGALLWNALGQEKPQDAAIRYALAGLVMAMSALAHISQIVNCLLFAVALLVLERRRWGKLPCWLPYVLTGLAAAVLTIVGLEVAGGGGLFSGLFLVFTQQNYLRIPLTPLGRHLLKILVNCAEIFPFICLPFVGILAVYLAVFYRRNGQAIWSGLMAVLAGGCGVCCLFYAIIYFNCIQDGFISQVRLWLSAFQNGGFVAILAQPLFCLYLFACLLSAGILTVYLMVLYRWNRQTILPGLMAALVGGCGVCCLFYAVAYIRIFQNGDSFISPGRLLILCLFLTAPVWFFLLPKQERRRFLPVFLFIWVAGLVSIVIIITTSHGSVSMRYGILSGGAFLSLPLAAAAFKARASSGLFPSKVCKALLLFMAGSLAVSGLSFRFVNFSYEDPLSTLTCRVERGVYKGLYTTPERAEALQNLEEQLQARVSLGEAVLFADLMPMAYLMTDGQPCTPTSWDPCNYRYGFQDDDLYQSYFEKTGCVPDKIFFIQSDEFPLSIDDPENEFATWVHAHYTLEETVGEGLFSFRLFTKNQ